MDEGDAAELRKRLLFERHIFTGGAGAHTVRLLPALSLPMEEAQRFIDEFRSLIAS